MKVWPSKQGFHLEEIVTNLFLIENELHYPRCMQVFIQVDIQFKINRKTCIKTLAGPSLFSWIQDHFPGHVVITQYTKTAKV